MLVAAGIGVALLALGIGLGIARSGPTAVASGPTPRAPAFPALPTAAPPTVAAPITP